MRVTFLKHSPRFLRVPAYALGALLILAALGVAAFALLVRHTHDVETVRCSDGKLATVRTDRYELKSITLYKDTWVGGQFLGSILRITDKDGTYTWWTTRAEHAIMAVDLRGGYLLGILGGDDPPATKPWMRGCWLGPHGECVPGFPADLPLRRVLQNLDVNPYGLSLLKNFDPAHRDVRESPTACLWWRMRKGTDVGRVPKDFIKEILETEFGGARDLTKVTSEK